MAWGSRILGGGLVFAISMLQVGCISGPVAALGNGPATDGLQLTAFNEPTEPRLARSQVPEQGTPPADAPKAGLKLPPAESNLVPSGNPVLTTSATVISPRQAAALIEGSKVRVKVRAWVNGRPIFDDELMQKVGPFVMEAARLPEPGRSEKVAELFTMALENMIDQEVMYQDAVKKLEKHNPKALAKLREMVNNDFEKRLKKIREAGASEEQIREFAHTARRNLERENIAGEYARNRIIGYIEQQVTHEVVQEYYERHKNEFKTDDKVEWQDVFIAVGPKHPTLADARRFAEGLLVRYRVDMEFAKIQVHDDGDSKLRGGEGLGQRRGDIRPQELEAPLFELKEGQLGPLVELPTGVHIFRVLKREYAGILPMNDQTQKQIRRNLEKQIAEREYKQLTRELRSRAVIQLVREVQ
jgi:peptidyl-prolyl cis-trans isomerase SurA